MKNKKIKVLIQSLSISIMFNMLVGCSYIKSYSEIKKDPIVLDVEIYQKGDEIICKVILENDVYLDDTSIKTNHFKEIVQKEFKDSNIIIIFIQNKIESGIY